MFGKFFSKKVKRKALVADQSHFNDSISPSEKTITLAIIAAFDGFILDLEEFSAGKSCQLQSDLKDERHLDMARSELLVLCFRYLDFSAGQANFNSDAGSIVYTAIINYINSLSVKFPTPNFNNSQDFFEDRLIHYSDFCTHYFSKDINERENSLSWLLSIISIRPLQQITPNEISNNTLFPVDTDIANMMLFPMFFHPNFDTFVRKIDACFQ